MLDKKTLDDFDWNQLSITQLKLAHSKISAAIKQKKSNSQPLQVNEICQRINGQNYKIRVSQVSPEHMRSSIFEYQKCVFGISLSGNQNFSGARLEACVRWIHRYFKSCLVIVGDSIHRHTIEIESGLKGDVARSKALHMGREFVDLHRSLFDYYSGSCAFEFMMTSEVEKHTDFELYLDDLKRLYQENKSFKTTVRSFVQEYLNRGDKVGENQVDEVSRLEHLSVSYLLEESAIFACLVKEGWSVMVYPGSIKALEEMVDGKHPEVPAPLRKMIQVRLSMRKAGVLSVPNSLEV